MDNWLQETRRRELLGEVQSMDDSLTRSLDSITRCAADLTGCPIALVSLVAGEREHFLSHFGWDSEGAPREWSFCTYAIGEPAGLNVPDALSDARFKDSPLVTGPPHIRSYFARNLTIDDIVIGTLCVIDHRPRNLDAHQMMALSGLAAGAQGLLATQRSMGLLASSQDRIADFALASGDWFWETDANHRLKWASTGLSTAWGIENDFAVGRQLPPLQLRDEAGDKRAPCATLFELLIARQRFARAVICHEGQESPTCLSLSAVPLYDGENFKGFRGTARDISARVDAERRRRQASHALERIAAEVPGLIYQFRLHPDGHFSCPYASERIVDLLEVTSEEVRQNAEVILQRIHPADVEQLTESLRQSADTLERWSSTHRILLPRKGERVHAAQAMPERLEDGSIAWYGVATDVTDESREREQVAALRIERDTAARSAHMRAELMSRVSHELRTPLNAILGFAQLLRLRYPDTAIEPGVSARHIHHAGEHLLLLINDMLDIAALEAGRFEIYSRATSIRKVIERAIDLVTPQANEKSIFLQVEIGSQVEGVVADERVTQQILMNLLANAIKFSPAAATVRLIAEANEDTDRVCITVCDEGPGIAAERRARMFEPFERLGVGAQYAGTGLGLSISQRLAHLMEGTIALVDSNRGTRICVCLPRAHGMVEEVHTTDFVGLEEGKPIRTRPLKLLYIEDDPVNILVMQGFIEISGGVQMQVAESAAQGLQAALAQPDVIFLDMHLPDGDGFGVLRALKSDSRTSHIPVVAVSADAMPDQVEDAMRAGFGRYLTKPVVHSELVDVLHSAGRWSSKTYSSEAD